MYVVVTWMYLRLTRTLPEVTPKEDEHVRAKIDPHQWIAFVKNYMDYMVALRTPLPFEDKVIT